MGSPRELQPGDQVHLYDWPLDRIGFIGIATIRELYPRERAPHPLRLAKVHIEGDGDAVTYDRYVVGFNRVTDGR